MKTILACGLVALVVALAGGCTEQSSQTSAQAVELRFSIEGMHCDGCVQAITTAVGNMDGVQACAVSLDEESATVTADDPALAAQIIEKINALGYTAQAAEG
jgi:copper ion binding protein